MEKEEIVFPRIQPDADTKNPEPPPWLLENIAEATKSARTLHIVCVSILVYLALTALGVSDRQIIFDEQARLPIADLHVSFTGFVIIAPVVAIVVFIYFHLHLESLAATLFYVRSTYAVDKRRPYPWILTADEGLETGLMRILRKAIVKLSLWWLLVMVLLLITFVTTKKHEYSLSLFVWSLSSTGTLLVFYVWYRHDASKRSESGPRPGLLKRSWRLVRTVWGKGILALICMLLYSSLFYFILSGHNWGNGYSRWRYYFKSDYQLLDDLTSVDLSNQVLVAEQKEEYTTYWLTLKGVHLETAKLFGTFMKRADLDDAHLRGAMLVDTNLEGASLSKADFRDAYLYQVRLKGAKMEQSHFEATAIFVTDLQRAALSLSNLQDSDIYNSDLQESVLGFTRFSGASLRKVNLRRALGLTLQQFSDMRSLNNSQMDESLYSLVEEFYPYLLLEDPVIAGPVPGFQEYNAHGDALLSQGRYVEAEMEYRKALASSTVKILDSAGAVVAELPDVSYPMGPRLCNLANSLICQQKFSEAEVEYRKAIASNPKEAIFHDFLGSLLAIQKRFVDAEVEYRDAVRLEPDYAHYHFRLATALQDQKKLEESEGEYREALKLAPNDMAYHYFFSFLLYQKHKHEDGDKARKEIERIQSDEASHYGENPEEHYGLGNMLLGRQKYADAEVEYRKAVDLDSNRPRYHYGLATAMRLQSKLTDA